MCAELTKRIPRVPLQFEGQILLGSLTGHPESTPVHETKQPQFLVMPTAPDNTVKTTHGILAWLKRSIQFVHISAPRHREDEA